MLTDIATVVRKELREILLPDGTFQAGARNGVIFLGIAGVLFPLESGPQWFTSWSTIFSACFPLMMVLSHGIDVFAGERERHTLETLLASRLDDRAILFGKTLAVVLYGWGLVVAALPVGIVAVNVVHRGPGFLFFRPAILASIVVLAFLVALFWCAIAAVVSLGAPTVRVAGQRMLVPFAAIFSLPFGLPFVMRKLHWNPTVAHFGPGSVVLLVAVVCLLGSIVTLAIGLRRFTRERLVLA